MGLSAFWDLMDRGGVVMWPLLVLSVVGVALCFERALYWLGTHWPRRTRRVQQIMSLLRRGQREEARQLAAADHSVYGEVALAVMDADDADPELAAVEAVEAARPRLERFMPTLSTIITAAPMIGILGTVLGIIASFQVLSEQISGTDPQAVSGGIAEALLTTAAGLIVAIVILFPYNAFRAQIDRAFGRIEALAAAAARCRPASATSPTPSTDAQDATK